MSYASVESYLSSLDETYGSFSTNQTTLGVSSDRYERERERAGHLEIYTKVRNERSEVLHVRNEGSLELPSTTTTTEQFEQVASSIVENLAGIECRIEDVERATILGVRDAGNTARETVYSLSVVFEATHRSGSANENAVWKEATELPDAISV